MSYESPIDFILNNEEIKKDGNIVTEFRQYDVVVKDLKELAKALNYDREQYKAGYKDALETITDRIIYNMRKLEPKDYKEIALYNHLLKDIETISGILEKKSEGYYMAKLTEREKAARYEALQAAIDIMIDIYKRREQDAKAKYTDATIIGAYNKGLADAYKEIVKTLRDFKN